MLHTKTVKSELLGLLNILMEKDYLKDFVLVGGTALSLQIGHRMSIDLDLFTLNDFDAIPLRDILEDDFDKIRVSLEKKNTLISTINDVKVDFIKFKYGFQYPLIKEDGIRMANIMDIIPMKIDAITGRGKKKDFYDLYFLLQQFSIDDMLVLYQNKYKHSTLFHVIKSINYFEDAESEADPQLFDETITWAHVKACITQEIRNM